jgi:glutamyl-tRNA synthetase
VAAAVPLVKGGAHTTLELADLTAYALLQRPIDLSGLDEKTRKRLDPETLARLGRLHDRLNGFDDWTPHALEAEIRQFAESEGVGLGKFGPALRVCLAGPTLGPDLASALTSLGKAESLGRMQDALS